MRAALYLSAGLLALMTPQVAAAETLPAPKGVEQKPLTLERIFGSPSLYGKSPRGVSLSPDGKYMTYLQHRAEDKDRYDLWALDTATGKRMMLVDSEKVGTGAELSEAEKMQRERARIGSLKGIVKYDWAPDGQSILVPLDGDLYLVTIAGKVTRLTDSEAGELNPEISPAGQYVSFVRDQKLWVGKIGEEPKPITPGEGDVHWGEAEFVAQEELGKYKGYWWNEQDSRIAVQWYDESNVEIVVRTSIGAEETKTYEQRYPYAGSDNVVPHLVLMNPDGSGKVEVDLGEDKDIYLTDVDWAPDGKTAYAHILNRVQDRLDLLAIDAQTGKSRVLFSEKAAKGHWINLGSSKFLKDGSIIWESERSGRSQLHRFHDGKWSQITNVAGGNVKGLIGVNEETKTLFYVANATDILSSQIFKIRYDQPGAKAVLISDPDFNSSAGMDKDATRLIVYRSSPSSMTQSYLADTDGKMISWIEENAFDADHPYAPYLASHELPKFGSIKGPSGDTLYWEMITPPNMKKGEKYPVFFNHYGGPHNQSVVKGFGSTLDQYLVDQGYIVFTIDNRGSANRGVEFEKAIYHAMGGPEVEDQKAGADYLKTLPFVDPDRIAIYGWSYGGYMTLKRMQAHPGYYAAGISGAPVTKWELYDTAYTERYMGDPRVVPEAYKKANAIDDAVKITDPLLVIHGMSDDNVVFQNSTALFAKMQGEAIPFEMMVYPGYTHRVGGPKISPHMWQGILSFLERNGVPGGPR